MQTDIPVFSVVLPCYNRAQMLEGAIQSVISQQFTDWELLVVDDGSTDDSKAVVEQFADARIRYIWQDNAERGAARNTGIKNSRGSFICFLDSDDYFLPNHLTIASEVIQSNPAAHVFHLNYEFRDRDGRVTTVARSLPGILNKLLIRENVISCNGIFIARNVFDRHMFSEVRDLSGTEDYELWLRIASFYPIRHIDTVTSVIVIHTDRSMENANIDVLKRRIEAFLLLINQSEQVRKFIGSEWGRFNSNRLSYISLHAALANEKKMAFRYLFRSWTVDKNAIFTKRSLVILKLILLKK